MNESIKWGNIVREIQGGNEAAFNDLYEATQSMVLFRVRGYLDRGDTGMWVEDAVQETYIRAFRYLPELKEPDTVQAWLGKIAGSVCLNMLKKNGRMSTDSIDDEDRFDLVLEADESVMPDRVVDRQDTSDIVAGMIEKLPPEQRMTLLYYYYDLLPVKEIATIMECSENTVKSRLKYGRDNIEKQVRAEEKRGIKLYSFSPVAIFQVFSRMERETVMSGDMAARLAQRIAEGCGYTIAGTSVAGVAASVGTVAAKQTFFHTAGGKILAGILGLALIGGAGVGVGVALSDRSPVEPNAVVEDTVEYEPVDEEVFVDVADEEFPELLRGNLTKEETEFVLAKLPQMISPEGIMDSQLSLLSYLILFENGEWDYDAGLGYLASDMNRFLALVTEDHLMTEENQAFWTSFGYQLAGDMVYDSIAAQDDMLDRSEVMITRAQRSNFGMYIEYDMVTQVMDWEEETVSPESVALTAYLQPDQEGKYMLKEIWPGTYADRGTVPDWKYAYAKPIEMVGTPEDIEAFYRENQDLAMTVYYSDELGDHPVFNSDNPEHYPFCDLHYTVYDIDQDGTPELIFEYTFGDGVLGYVGYYSVYTYDGDIVKEAGAFRNEFVEDDMNSVAKGVTVSSETGELISVYAPGEEVEGMEDGWHIYVVHHTLQSGKLISKQTALDGVELLEDIPDSVRGDKDLGPWMSPYGNANLRGIVTY